MSVFLIQQPKCVFIHIPKTGGASIRYGFFQGNVDGPFHGFVPQEWMGLFKFAFVRHPLDRLISAWKMFSDGMQQSVWEQPQEFNRAISLSDFLNIVVDETIPFGENRDNVNVKIRHHAIPQTHPFNCLQYADFVGRYEFLERDFVSICERIGVVAEKLPHWNRTDRTADYMSYFDADSLRVARDYYAADFQRLGYQ
jgi:hypothetical protein